MQSLSEAQLRHLAVITNRLAAMDGRALFKAMQTKPRPRVHRAYMQAEERMQRYAFSMQAIRAELARRGLS